MRDQKKKTNLVLLITLMGILFLSACRAGIPAVIDYPNLGVTIIRTTHRNVAKVCGRHAITWDDGSLILDKGLIAGCWLKHKKEIWIRWDAPELLLHELCHAEGKSRRTCDKIHWYPRD